MAVRAAIEKIQQAGRKISEPSVAQRPDRRPFELGRWIEWCRGRHVVRLARGARRRPISPGLRVAVQENVVRRNGVAWREIHEPPRHSDLVALKNSGITLDRLHERAGFALLGRAALAEAATAQSGLEIVDGLGAPRKIVRGIVI